MTYCVVWCGVAWQHEYHVMLGTFDDYAEMIIQFGYATMFVAAFPLAAAMSFVNNYIGAWCWVVLIYVRCCGFAQSSVHSLLIIRIAEIRVDGWKLCQICRRPEPRSAEDIGTW